MIDSRRQEPRDSPHSWRTTARAPRCYYWCTRFVDLKIHTRVITIEKLPLTIFKSFTNYNHSILHLHQIREIKQSSCQISNISDFLITFYSPLYRSRLEMKFYNRRNRYLSNFNLSVQFNQLWLSKFDFFMILNSLVNFIMRHWKKWCALGSIENRFTSWWRKVLFEVVQSENKFENVRFSAFIQITKLNYWVLSNL